MEMPVCWFFVILFFNFKHGSHLSLFAEFHCSNRLAGLDSSSFFIRSSMLLIRSCFFRCCLWISLHKIGQKFSFQYPGWHTKCNGWFSTEEKKSEIKILISNDLWLPDTSIYGTSHCFIWLFMALVVACVFRFLQKMKTPLFFVFQFIRMIPEWFLGNQLWSVLDD